MEKNNIPVEKSKIIHEINIGNVHLDNNLVLAPMAGVTDIAYRPICKEMGAGLVCMEMVSAKAIVYNNKKTAEMLETRPEERPVSLQLSRTWQTSPPTAGSRSTCPRKISSQSRSSVTTPRANSIT